MHDAQQPRGLLERKERAAATGRAAVPGVEALVTHRYVSGVRIVRGGESPMALRLGGVLAAGVGRRSGPGGRWGGLLALARAFGPRRLKQLRLERGIVQLGRQGPAKPSPLRSLEVLRNRARPHTARPSDRPVMQALPMLES
jgi:hypothetical protein